LEGYVNIETKDGLKLNRLGIGEIFGESSILLNVPRTVTAKVCAQKLVTKIIPKSYFKEKRATSTVRTIKRHFQNKELPIYCYSKIYKQS
jgi:CRP-like cAMP-binding protein